MRKAVLAAVLAALFAAPASAAPPTVTYQISGTLGDNGWYVSPVIVTWQVTGQVTTDGCEPGLQVTADTSPAGTNRTCVATNADGDTSVTTKTFRIDRTPPSVTSAALARSADWSGWFNHQVGIAWSGSDQASGIASCSAYTYAGPDSATASPAGTCRDVAGNVSAPRATSFKYDATPPTVTGATPDRAADSNGWYVRPLAMAFAATDATSGVDSCDTVTYQGPDGPAAGVNGACRDKAGNVGVRTVPIAYDANPPKLSRMGVVAGDTVTTVSWRASSDTKQVRIMRKPGPSKPVYQGNARRFGDRHLRNGVRYRYTLTAIDGAGHQASGTIRARPHAWLIAPSPGAHRQAPPWLRWKRVKRATYYNIQLYRGKRKILSAWPSRPRLKLTSAWRYNGHWHRLSAGRYRWYMWPAYGNRSQRRYGQLRGARSFTMI